MDKINTKILDAFSRLRDFLKKDIFSRCWVIYLVLFISFFVVGDYKGTIRAAGLQMVSRLAPDFDYYKTFIITKAPTPKDLTACVDYYTALAGIVEGERGQAYSMAAYCEYFKGEKVNAIKTLDKAIEYVPSFFWSNFNRGVYYFNEGDFSEAARSFNMALGLNPRSSLFILRNTKIYMDILFLSPSQPESDDPTKRLVAGYKKAEGYLDQSAACIVDPRDAGCRRKLEMSYF